MVTNKRHDAVVARLEARVDDLIEKASVERSVLMNRIQHPELVPVAVDESHVEVEDDADALELSLIGQVVPDYINLPSEHDELDRVGTASET